MSTATQTNGSAGRAVAAALAPRSAPASQATHVEQSRAVAEVQAMAVMARQNQRDETRAVGRLLDSCKIEALAKRAFFKFSRGGSSVAGESIHLATEMARCWGNVAYGVAELARNDASGESEMVAWAWDVETNVRAATTFIVPHKRDKKGGAELLTDMRDIYENNANNAARRLREMIFRVLPPWLREQAKEACMSTLEHGGGQPLVARIGKALGAFANIGVSRERIEAKFGMSADKFTPIEMAQLEVSFQSIRRAEVSAEDEFPTLASATVEQALGGGGAPATGTKAPSQQSDSPTDDDLPPVRPLAGDSDMARLATDLVAAFEMVSGDDDRVQRLWARHAAETTAMHKGARAEYDRVAKAHGAAKAPSA